MSDFVSLPLFMALACVIQSGITLAAMWVAFRLGARVAWKVSGKEGDPTAPCPRDEATTQETTE